MEYNALLQMYGEKSEETDELKMDLQDVKEMYKLQVREEFRQTKARLPYFYSKFRESNV